MNLYDFTNRSTEPEPWGEGDNIPWNDPAFSERMLQEHFNQQYDAASRRTAKIDQQVSWIHSHLLLEHQTSILDLGCGPGLYTSRLARLGHRCTGIDFSPASIRYATQQAAVDTLSCAYLLSDMRLADYGNGHGLVMFIYGEFNVFKPKDAQLILAKARASLAPGGILLLECSRYSHIESWGHKPATWYTSQYGIFSDQPHLVCGENFWNSAHRTTTTRYFIMDAQSAEISRYAATYQAYTDDEYCDLLTRCGFDRIALYPSLTGELDESQADFLILVAQKPGG